MGDAGSPLKKFLAEDGLALKNSSMRGMYYVQYFHMFDENREMEKMGTILKCAFVVLTFLQCQQKDISGTVVKVADGDTFTILTDDKIQVRIRLHGIDAPERGQDFSNVSRSFLTQLIINKQVLVNFTRKDQYGRIVGIAVRGDTVINEQMLKAGLAWHYKEYDKQERWALLEQNARRNRSGLWSMPDPVEPWKFRQRKRERARP